METLFRLFGNGNPPANPPTQPAPVADNDYTVYRKWADEARIYALRDDSDPQWIADTLNQWQQLTPQVQAWFASAVRDLRQAERTFTEASTTLDVTLERVLARTLVRMSRKATTQLYQELHAQLKTRLAPATNAARILEELVDVHQYEDFEDDMRNFATDQCLMYRYDRGATAYWLQRSKDLQNDGSVGGTVVNIARELVTIIEAGYDAPDEVPVEDMISPEEGDQDSEVDEDDGGDPGNGNGDDSGSGNGDDPGNGGGDDPGNGGGDDPGNGGGDDPGNGDGDDSDSGDGHLNRFDRNSDVSSVQSAPASTKRKREPSDGDPVGEYNRRVYSAPARDSDMDGAAEAWQAQHPPDNSFAWPLLQTEPHPHTRLAWLYAGRRAQFPRSFARWCKRHLDAIANQNFNGLDAFHSFANAAYEYWFGVDQGARHRYDWNKVAIIRGPPYNVSPVRHLHYLIRDQPQEAKDSFNRQLLDNDDVNGWDVQNRAAYLVRAYSDPANARVDWTIQNDFFRMKAPSPSTTSKLPMQGLHRSVNGRWMLLKKVGEGGNGRALLYVKFNSSGTIIQRMIVKEAFVATTWRSESLWNGPPGNRIPLEGHLHRLMDRGHQSVIGFLGDHVNRRLRMIRTYTSYGELGDLQVLVDNHERLWRMSDENGDDLDDNITRIPALVVICLCESMAASVCLMAHGQLPDDQGRWQPGFGNGNAPQPLWMHDIIHRDIKPSNYFLTECRDPTRWRGLPIAALGDFGNGFDARNPPTETKGMGTPGQQAPEQEHNRFPVTSATNVFQVGLVMHELMTLSHPSQQPTFQPRRETLFPIIDTGFYPADLAAIAQRCIRSDIGRRPSPKALYLSMRNLANGTALDGTPRNSWLLRTVPASQFVLTGPGQKPA